MKKQVMSSENKRGPKERKEKKRRKWVL